MDLYTQSLRKGKSYMCCEENESSIFYFIYGNNCGRNPSQHVASNKYTRYRPYPTPTQFAASQDLISRMTVFLRRELLVWPNADVEVCTCIVFNTVFSIPRPSTNPNCATSTMAVLGDFCDFSHEIHRHPLRERDQVAC